MKRQFFELFLENGKAKKVQAISLSILVIGLAFFLGYHEKRTAEEAFDRTLNLWGNQLSRAMLSGDGTFVENLAEGIAIDPLSQVTFTNDKGFSVSFPHQVQQASCLLEKSTAISRYGLRVGTAKACFSTFGLVKQTLFSPLFILLVGCIGIAIWISYVEVQRAQSALKRAQELSALASQVAHDIRSPLAALDVALNRSSSLPADQRTLVRGAVGRIHDIANQLLQRNKGVSSQTDANTATLVKSEMLSPIIENLLSEKRVQYKTKLGIEIEYLSQSSYGAFAYINLLEFKRILSNLIDNAVEAIDGSGRITVSLLSQKTGSEILITDNGKGISSEILPKLMQEKMSIGKLNGNGLGLFHAKKNIEDWNGQITIESAIGQGTTVHLILPTASSPHWFIPKIQLADKELVVIVDDDISVHEAWDARFASIEAGLGKTKVIHFSVPDEFIQWMKTQPNEVKALFLVDYEFLEHRMTGVDLIELLAIETESILVTSRNEETSVLEQCRRLNLRMMPKGMLGVVPITTESDTKEKCILIEDNPFVQSAWQLAAENLDKKLYVFSEPSSLLSQLPEFEKDTKIYIDCDLGPNQPDGETLSKRLHEMGFENLYLATGYEEEQLKHCSWIKGVIGKTPPWGRE